MSRLIPLLLLPLAFCLLPFAAAAEEEDNPRRLPSYEQCRIIEDEKTPLKEKLLLQLSFFPHKPVCTLMSEPFMAHNVFNKGKTRVRLKLAMGKENYLEIERGSLIRALLPDKDHIPKDRAHEVAKTAAALVSGMGGDAGGLAIGVTSGQIDPMSLLPMALRLGTFAGDVGRNAELVEAILELMRRKHGLGPEEAVCPSWLPGLKSLAGNAGNNLIPPHLRAREETSQVNTSPLGAIQNLFKHLQKFFGQLPLGNLVNGEE